MTIAVAVRKRGRTVFAADSLVNFGGQRFPAANCQFHKIHRIGDSLLAWAGWSLYAELLTAHLESNPPPTLNSESEVFAFFVKFWRSMRQDFTLVRRGADGESHPFADLDSVFLLANRSGIYRIASDMDVTKFRQYDAIGSGSKYALGALLVLYGQLDDPEEIARRAVQVGIDSDVYCGGTIDVITLEDGDENPHPGPEVGDQAAERDHREAERSDRESTRSDRESTRSDRGRERSDR